MKVGIVSAPALLANGIDLFDFYNVEYMYDDSVFIKSIYQSKAECDYTFVFIEGVGLFPSTHLSIPLTPILNSNYSIASSFSEIKDIVADFIPDLADITFQLNTYGRLPKKIKDLILAS